MQKVYCLYKLRPEVSPEKYIEWSKTVDQVLTRQQACVHGFKVFLVEGARSGDAPWDVVEDIDVDSWEAWNACLATPAMADVVSGFREMAYRESAVTVFGTEIG